MKILTVNLRSLLALGVWMLLVGCSAIFAQGGGNNVTICWNGHTISVNQNAVQNFLGRGATMGPCPEDCINPNLIDPNRFCITLYDPVCGCNGVTYSNGCVATFGYGVTSYTPGACNTCVGTPQNIFCPTYVDPVCGCNGVTYSNACFAVAAGVTSYTPGACGGGVIGKTAAPQVTDATIVPNPTTGKASYQWVPSANGEARVTLVDMMGKVVMQSPTMEVRAGVAAAYGIDATILPEGVYLVQLQAAGTVTSQRLVVRH